MALSIYSILLPFAFSSDLLNPDLSTNPYILANLDIQNCCQMPDFSCQKLGDGICDEVFNTNYCSWDMGDCGYCSPGCFFHMLNDGVCDDECLNESCNYDYSDCSKRKALDLAVPKYFQNITVNSAQVPISLDVSSYLGHFTFSQIHEISGEIEFTEENSELTSVDLNITGDLTIFDLYLLHNPSYSVNVNVTNGTLMINNLMIEEGFSLDFIMTDSAELVIQELTSFKSGAYYNFSLVLQVLNGSYNFAFQRNLNASLSFKALSKNSEFSISNLNISNASLAFSAQNSKMSISSSFISELNSTTKLFVLKSSSLTLNSSSFQISSSFTFFTLEDRSELYIYSSNVSSCNNMPLITSISDSYTVRYFKSSFENCSFDKIVAIQDLTICSSASCSEIPTISYECPDGQMDLDGCKYCPMGTYRFASINQLSCFECGVSMNCTGASVYPAQGYYRYQPPNSQIFRKCFNPNACFSTSGNESTQCAPGYYGSYCAGCIDTYTEIGPYTCGYCPSTRMNWGILSLLVVLFSAAIIWMIKSTVLTAFEPSQLYSIAIKIGINYFQVIYLCLQYKITWPGGNNSGVVDDSGSKGSMTSKTNLYFSLKCLLGITSDIDYYYIRVAFMAALPIFLFLLAGLYLGILKLSRKSKHLNYYKTASLVVPFLLVYPYVITYTLSPLACTSPDPDSTVLFKEHVDYNNLKYLMENPNISCTWEDHYRKIVWVTGFSLIVWGLGVPTLIFILLFKRRKNLFELDVKYKYGFLISGYMHEHYYWEIIIFIKKLLIVFLTVFMQTGYNLTTQSVLLITFLIFAFISQIYYMPYITYELNRLEVLASLSAIITVLSAVVYTNLPPSSNNIEVFLIICISFINIIFLLQWLWFFIKKYYSYVIVNVEFLKKRFSKSDGFDEDLSKEFKRVDFIYIKEFQKLYTQIQDEKEQNIDYLGQYKDMKQLLFDIIKTDYEKYKENKGPTAIGRQISRRLTLTGFNAL